MIDYNVIALFCFIGLIVFGLIGWRLRKIDDSSPAEGGSSPAEGGSSPAQSITAGTLQFFGGLNNSYVSYPVASNTFPRANSFTLEMWIKQDPTVGAGNANAAPRPFIISGLDGLSGTQIFGVSLEGDAERRTCYIRIDDTNVLSYNQYPVDNAWHHLAVVGQGGTRIALYVDGTQATSVNTAYDIAGGTATSKHINVGSYPEVANTKETSFVGYLANVLFDTSQALYTGTSFQVSTTAPTSESSTALLLLAVDNATKYVDSSSNNLTPTSHGDPAPTWSSQTITF